jgi:hypothetical protein
MKNILEAQLDLIRRMRDWLDVCERELLEKEKKNDMV